jgi:polyphosphate kinase
VEAVFPLLDPALKDRVKFEMLNAYLADNAKTRLLARGGSYRRPDSRGRTLFNAQEFLIDVAEGRRDASSIPLLAPKSRSTRTRKARTTTKSN